MERDGSRLANDVASVEGRQRKQAETRRKLNGSEDDDDWREEADGVCQWKSKKAYGGAK